MTTPPSKPTRGMPPFLMLLFFVEMWERFSYYGMRALLVLFLTSSLGFSDPNAYAIYSLFAALGYAGPVIGGWLADRLMGFRSMVTLGGVLITIGHMLMALVNIQTFFLYLGLGFIAVGVGMFKGNISNLLGCCYRKDDPERARGFVLFYVSVNLGSVLASISCGYVAHVYGWHFGFGLAAVGMLAGLLAFARYQSILGEHGLAPEPAKLKQRIGRTPLTLARAIMVACVLAAFVSAFLLQAHQLFSQLLSFFGVGVLGVLGYELYRATPDERRNLSIIATLLIFFMCFFAMEMQLGSLINLFTQRNVDKSVFGFVIPAAVSQAINPFSIIVLGPLLSPLFVRMGNRWSMLRFGLGLTTMVVCFLLLYLSSFQANAAGEVPYLYLLVSIAFMGLGELCLAPLIYSICTVLSPDRMRGFMMGVINLAMSFANLAGFIIAGLMSVPKGGAGESVDAFTSLAIYQAGFYQIMLFNVGLVAVFALCYPVLNRICRTQLDGYLASPGKTVVAMPTQEDQAPAAT